MRELIHDSSQAAIAPASVPRSLVAELYRVSALSPASYVLPALEVGTAVMLASWIPARSARTLDLIVQTPPE